MSWRHTAALFALAALVQASPASAVIIDSVDGAGNVSAPSATGGPTTFGFEAGSVNVQARRASDQVLVWQGTLGLDGAFATFDPAGTPSQFGLGTLVDFSLLMPAAGPFALLQPYGLHDQLSLESVVVKPAPGYATNVGFQIGPDTWSITAGPVAITGMYAAVDTGGIQAPAEHVLAPLATGTLVGTITLSNGQQELDLNCAVTATLDGSGYGKPGLQITGDFSWEGSVAAATPDPGWAYVGDRGGLTAVYLGDGWVLTANHVGAGDFTLSGTTYPMVPNSAVQLQNNDASLADVLVYKVSPDPGLPPLPLRDNYPVVGADAILIGRGRDRGLPTEFEPVGQGAPVDGWEWAPGTALRWGTNQVDGFPSGKVGGNVSVFTRFDENATVHEGQAADGDSGGALFVDNNGTWELGVCAAEHNLSRNLFRHTL